MSNTFSQSFRAGWADMDFNQHMRNAAYLGYSEQTRMLYLDANDWTMAEFMKRKIGPVVLEDRLTYRKELKLLEPFRVELVLAGITADGGRMRVRNRFLRESDGALAAVVDSLVLWMDLASRKPIAPPEELARLWQSLPRSEDFQAIE